MKHISHNFRGEKKRKRKISISYKTALCDSNIKGIINGLFY